MATPNLNLTHITASQNNKETTANAGLDGLDNAMNTRDPMTITGDTVVTAAELRGAVFFDLTGTPGATFLFSIPTGIERLFIISNQTDAACLVESFGEGTDSILLAIGAKALLYHDGSDIHEVASGGNGGGSGTTGITVEDESVQLGTLLETLNFTGAGVTAYLNSDGTVDIVVPTNGGAPGADGSSSVVSPFSGFRVTNDTTQAIANFVEEDIDLNTEIFDTEGAIAYGLFVVPSSLDGKYMSFTMGIKFSGNESGAAYIKKDDGGGFVIVGQANFASQDGGTASTGAMLLSTGDVYKTSVYCSTATIANNDLNYFTGHIVNGTEQELGVTALTTSRNLALADKGNVLEFDTSGGAVDIAIEEEAVVAYSSGMMVNFTAFDITAAMTVTADPYVTLNGVMGGIATITATLYAGASMYRRGADDWVIQGEVLVS